MIFLTMILTSAAEVHGSRPTQTSGNISMCPCWCRSIPRRCRCCSYPTSGSSHQNQKGPRNRNRTDTRPPRHHSDGSTARAAAISPSVSRLSGRRRGAHTSPPLLHSVLDEILHLLRAVAALGREIGAVTDLLAAHQLRGKIMGILMRDERLERGDELP